MEKKRMKERKKNCEMKMDAAFLYKCVSVFSVSCIFIFSRVYCLSGAFYADDGREQSVLYKPLASKEKQNLQKELLNILGLETRPKPRLHHRNNSAPLYLINIYKELEDLDKNVVKSSKKNGLRTLSDSDVIMSFVNRIHHKSPNLRHEKDKRFYFDTSEVPPDEEVFAAELRIYRDPDLISENLKKHVYILYLYAVHLEGKEGRKNVLEPVEEIIISSVDKGWLVFNVTSQFLYWMAFPRKNNGLFLKIKAVGNSHSFEPHQLGLIGSKGPEEKQPFLVAYFKTPEYLVRKPRATKKRHHDSSNYDKKSVWNPYTNTYPMRRSCQRWTLYVSFRDLGWEEWIIAPDGYGAFYCAGECSFPLNAHLNATNHAIIQTLVHLMSPSQVPKPCCAPTQLSAITVLYFDDSSNVILRKYRNMVVTGCGCH